MKQTRGQTFESKNMSWKTWFNLLFVLSVMFGCLHICTGDDFDDKHCKKYTQINETEYDRDPKSVNDLSKRPLGFMSAVIPFGTNVTNPCFKISLADSTRQTVEVLATSAVGYSVFCVKSEPRYALPTCQSSIKTCQDSPIGHDSIKYVFYCDDCEIDLPIWFRLTVSPSFTDGLDFENWCARTTEYPDSLISLTVPTLTTTANANQTKSTNNNTKSNAPVSIMTTTASAKQIKTTTTNNSKSDAPISTMATTSKASYASLTCIWLLSISFAFLLLY